MNSYAIIIASIIAIGSQQSAVKVWHWFGKCPQADTMCVEIRLQEKLIHQTSFPICLSYRNDIEPENPQKILKFYFDANCGIFETGEDAERDSLLGSLGMRRIEGNIWQAGKDTNSIYLGVSFVTQNRILLNSIHIAKHDSLSISEQAKGLIVRTHLFNKMDR